MSLLPIIPQTIEPSSAIAIGLDVEDIENVRRADLVGGQRRRERLFTKSEQADFCDDISKQATRFAIKEAVAKSLGTGFRDGLAARHIEVTTDGAGAPHVVLHGPARDLAELSGVFTTRVSCAKTDSTVFAIAISLSKPQGTADGQPRSKELPK